MTRTDSKMNLLKLRLKQQCADEEFLVLNPKMALEILNTAQRQEDPEAYEENIVAQLRKKQEQQALAKVEEKRRDALFDFEDSVDCLSEVSERYAEVNMFHEASTKDQGDEKNELRLSDRDLNKQIISKRSR